MAGNGNSGRKTIRKNGKPLTGTERSRRSRAKRRRSRRPARKPPGRPDASRVGEQLGILPLALADVTQADLASNIVDAVITDPPYGEADVPLYGELARFAMRVLKPSGWCLTMVGDLYLDRIIPAMVEAGLLWRGLIAVTFPGGHHSRIGTTKTFQAAKTVLMLQKPPTLAPPNWGPNHLVAAKNGHDKSLHPWQQSQEIFEKLVDRFTVPGDLVADPFAGSGTTLRAARVLGRSAWGADAMRAGL